MLEPLQLHVIPRVKYAEWLAKKYLDQASSSAISEVKFLRPVSLKLGAEYRGSRSYQPGDPLRDVD